MNLKTIEAQGIHLRYADNLILNNVSFSLDSNKVYGIFGQSGVGKSSLLNILAGIQNPSSGSILLQGKQMPYSSNLLVPGYPEVELVSGNNHLDVNHSCLENIRESILGWPNLLREARVQELLDIMGLQEVSAVKAKWLSEGEKQRLNFARALAKKPSWVLLDEPFAHLDYLTKVKMMGYVKTLQELDPFGMVMVTHEIQEIMMFCQQLAVIDERGNFHAFVDKNLRYFDLKNIHLARLMGPVNEVLWKNEKIVFRPTSFELCKDGINLKRNQVYFNGMVHVHFFTSSNNEEIILYYCRALPEEITIKPTFDEK
jgi:ABC-type multidrug transport system ATPase subunit